jgi:GTP-binding protein Era
MLPPMSIGGAHPLYNGVTGLYTRIPSTEMQIMARGRAGATAHEDETPGRRVVASGAQSAGGPLRVGYVALLGQTNVGKSTFLNAVLGEKLLISSAKPQATRNRIRCVLTTDEAQIIFVDTPGLHRARTKLGRHLVREAQRGTRGVDVILYMIEPWGKVDDYDRRTLERLAESGVPMLLLVNKIDRARGNALEETLLAYDALRRFEELIPISSTQGIGLDDAIQTTISYLPKGERLFPSDVKCDRPVEFLIEEAIREKVYQATYQEIPYSAAVHVKWLRDGSEGATEIQAEILVERESQKGILIGKAGQTVKRIGTLARKDIERLLGRRVFLKLIVQVSPGWTRNDALVRRETDS